MYRNADQAFLTECATNASICERCTVDIHNIVFDSFRLIRAVNENTKIDVIQWVKVFALRSFGPAVDTSSWMKNL